MSAVQPRRLMSWPGSDMASNDTVRAFLYREAALLDNHEYRAWLDLWADDGVYWIPAGGVDTDPETQVSFVYDNRRRLELRVKQLLTGYRYAQLPQSRTQHYISNIEVVNADVTRIEVRSSYLVIEARFGEINLWPGQATHVLAIDDEQVRIARKTVVLINNDLPVTTMGFLV